MAAPTWFNRLTLLLVAALALGLLAFLLWPKPQLATDDSLAGQGAGSQENPTASDLPIVSEAKVTATVEANRLSPSAGNAPETRRSTGQPINTAVTIPHDVAMADYKRELWYQIAANPPPLRRPGDPEVDADLAYRLYMFYGNCSAVARTPQQVDQKLGHIERRIERSGLRRLEGLEGRVDEIMTFYELCSAIPDDVDRRAEAVAWMTESVRLGHEIAEVQFYDKAMGFILRPDQHVNLPPLAMAQPGLVEQFKDTARLGMTRAIQKGHPEAFVAQSRAVLEGLIYPRDPQLAYAYARAAQLAAGKHRNIAPSADYWINAAAQYLDPEQIAEAEQLALDLQATAGSG